MSEYISDYMHCYREALKKYFYFRALRDIGEIDDNLYQMYLSDIEHARVLKGRCCKVSEVFDPSCLFTDDDIFSFKKFHGMLMKAYERLSESPCDVSLFHLGELSEAYLYFATFMKNVKEVRLCGYKK